MNVFPSIGAVSSLFIRPHDNARTTEDDADTKQKSYVPPRFSYMLFGYMCDVPENYGQKHECLPFHWCSLEPFFKCRNENAWEVGSMSGTSDFFHKASPLLSVCHHDRYSIIIDYVGDPVRAEVLATEFLVAQSTSPFICKCLLVLLLSYKLLRLLQHLSQSIGQLFTHFSIEGIIRYARVRYFYIADHIAAWLPRDPSQGAFVEFHIDEDELKEAGMLSRYKQLRKHHGST